MKKTNTKFFLDKNNNVYKLTNDETTLLKLSPWEIGEDRIVFNFEKKEKKFEDINKMPSIYDFAQWTNVKKCKVIYEDSTKK